MQFSANTSRYESNVATNTSNPKPLLALPNTTRTWNNKPNRPPLRKQLTQKEYEDKRAKNLCFYCDKKFVPGHKCEGQLYSLVVLGENEEMEKEFVDAEDSLEGNGSEEVQPQISLNALHGMSSFQTLRVVGLYADKHELHILVDSGSTHNFLDVNMATKLGCNIKRTCPLTIAEAGERQLVCVSECKGFSWKLRGETFTTDVMLLPLGGCDMVLGIQWLSTLGDRGEQKLHRKPHQNLKNRTAKTVPRQKPMDRFLKIRKTEFAVQFRFYP
ncbi:reverse transcriptase [Tanacetum coccineum]